MTDKKKYTVSDFARYHSGDMSAREMHELEKAALEDPFLSDALDGYIYSNDPVGEAKQLHARLQEKNKKEKTNWLALLRVAAILILIAGFAFWFLKPKHEQEMAMVQADSQVLEHDQLAVIPEDSIQEPPRAKTTPEKKPEKTQIAKVEKKAPEPAILKADSSHSALAAASAPLETELADSIARPQVSLLSDSNMIAAASAPHPKDSHNRLLLRENRATRPAIFKPADSARLMALKEAQSFRNFSMVSPLPEPVGGWKNFDNYLEKNKGNLKQTGAVKLEFVISLAGYPTKIAVLESTCPACEKTAIRLLRDGPKWKNSLDGKGEINLLF